MVAIPEVLVLVLVQDLVQDLVVETQNLLAFTLIQAKKRVNKDKKIQKLRMSLM